MLNLISRTPYRNLGSINRSDIFIKLECNQFGNSFKSRGVINFLQNIDKKDGLVTFTTGNHGIAVAAIAKELGIKSIVLSTNKLSPYKKTLIENYGATIELIDNHNLYKATEYAKKIATENNFTFVPLFDNEYLLAGYSQLTKEIYNDFAGDLVLYFPVGSGSLLYSNSKLSKSINQNNKVIGVEPRIYQRLNKTNKKGTSSISIADSLSIDRIPNSNLGLFKFTDSIETLDENEIAEATKMIYDLFNLITEPSGAITLAAAIKADKDKTKKIAIITGKNISEESFYKILKKKWI